jgi:hypothetical protein
LNRAVAGTQRRGELVTQFFWELAGSECGRVHDASAILLLSVARESGKQEVRGVLTELT